MFAVRSLFEDRGDYRKVSALIVGSFNSIRLIGDLLCFVLYAAFGARCFEASESASPRTFFSSSAAKSFLTASG